MRGLSLHSGTLVFAAAALLAAIPVASAGNPDVQHFTFGPFVTTDDDFCGTGTSVTETFHAHTTVWNEPNQPVDARNQSVGDDVFTSAVTGVTVVNHASFSFTDRLISGDPNGVNTHEWTFKGATMVTRVVGSGVLERDVGNLVVHTTWSGPEFDSELIDTEVVRDAGGHPRFLADFCATMIPALGLG